MASLIKDARVDIIHLYDELGGLVAKSVELVWQIGQKLSQVKSKLDHGEFVPWIEGNLPFTRRTAQNYLAVFEHYPAGLPADMDLRTAYLESGVKKLAAPEVQNDPGRGAGTLVIPQKDWAKEWARLSKTTPLSGTQLTNYRVVVNADDRVVYALRAGHYSPIPVAGMLMQPKAGAEAAWAEFNKLLQCATEEFLGQLELLEQAGTITPPADTSPLAKHEKAKKVAKGGNRVPD